MFIKLTRSGPRRYLQLVEAYRDENGRPRQRTVANLGRLEHVADNVDSIVRGLERATGKKVSTLPEAGSDISIEYQPARAIGHVWSLQSLWQELGFDRLRHSLKRSRRKIDVEALLRIMVFNRLCDPESRLGVLRWLESVTMPGMDTSGVRHQHLLRAMDTLIEFREVVDEAVASLLLPLIDQEFSVVFHDLTTISSEGLSESEEDVRQYGKSKDGGIRRQFVPGVVQTAEGLPIHHEVFDGNVAEISTLKHTLDTITRRFSITRVIAVADRDLLSLDNLEELKDLKTAAGKPLEYILAVPGRRYLGFVELLKPFHDTVTNTKGDEETIGECEWDGRRLVIAHDPVRAAERTAERDSCIKELEDRAADRVNKLDEQDGGRKYCGRKLSDGGARARFHRDVLEARLGNIVKVDLKSELFSYHIDRDQRRLAEMMDGKLLLVTNTPDSELSAEDVVARYKSLADIERGFRVLKSEIEVGPVYHRLPDRIRAHAQICFIALILHRVMRMKLRQENTGTSPERALEILRHIQHHEITIDNNSHSGISTMTAEQKAIMKSLNVRKPEQPTQLSLL